MFIRILFRRGRVYCSSSINTFSIAPTAPPLGLSGFARNSDSISLSWTPPLLAERNGMIRHYLINATEVDTGNVYGHVSLNTNFTLFSLHPYYTYMITVSAVTVAPGPATSPISIRTDQDGEELHNFHTPFLWK